MRVAYICADPGVPVFGQKGCSVHLQEVLRALLKKQLDVELFAARVGGNPPRGLEGIPVHPLPSPPKKGNPQEREKAAWAANQNLTQALESASAFDCVYERYSLWSFAGMEYARDHSIPGLLEVNAPLIEEQEKFRELIDRDKAEEAARRNFGAASALLPVSKEVASYLKARQIPESRVHVVPNGIDPARFPETNTSEKSRSTFTLGFVGTLKPWHGVEHLIDAFALLHKEHPDTRLTLIGDGPQREELRALLSAHGLMEAAHFTGSVSPDEVPEWLASLDVAVAPYPELTDFYFSPLKIFEYMAAGLPIVASEVGQITEVIQDSVNGLLVTPGDPKALKTAIARLHREPELRARLGQAARDTVLEKYTWDKVAGRILQIAEESAEARESLGGRPS